jgi:MoaA/NifB/PqqE/SkfB family radical SAM enzyme
MRVEIAARRARPSALDHAQRFDFVAKLAGVPDKAAAALAGDPVGSLAVVYLDVNTDICNHACPFCDGYHRSLKSGLLPTERLLRLVDEMESLGVLGVVIAGDRGEPLLHPGMRDLLRRLAASTIEVGLYTNGTLVKPLLPELDALAWVRVSADAGSAGTHRLLHGYPHGRDDFDRMLDGLRELGRRVGDVGASFVLDPENVHEIELAADVLLPDGAHFVEYKPKYLAGYRVDGPWLREQRRHVVEALDRARQRWGDRVVVNAQVDGLLTTGALPSLHVAERPCHTSMLRMVVSTHGCYSCTPYRGEAERRFGDIRTQSLTEVLTSPDRQALVGSSCTRRCAYHDQNEALLARADGVTGTGPQPAVPRPQAAFV